MAMPEEKWTAVSCLEFPNVDRQNANDKDFSLALEMTI